MRHFGSESRRHHLGGSASSVCARQLASPPHILDEVKTPAVVKTTGNLGNLICMMRELALLRPTLARKW